MEANPIVTATSAGAFPFIGEALALDLVNTQVVVRGKPRDLLTAPNDLAAWWSAASKHYPNAGLAAGAAEGANDGEALLATAHELRAALRAIFDATINGDSVAGAELAVLNRVLGGGHDALAVGEDGRLRPFTASHGIGPDAVLVPIAQSAFALLTGKDLTRLHRCANERCVLLFYDTTKSATRRWCSTACMNRARSAARHQAKKAR